MHAVLIYTILPLLVSNTLHMLVVKKNLFAFLATPVASTCFGANKTWRGFVFLPLINGISVLLLCFIHPFFSWQKGFFLGFVFGLAYMFFELPNSWLKRKSGIAPGGKAEKNAWFFGLLDKMDSSLGVSLAAMIFVPLNLVKTALLFAVAVISHAFFSWLLTIFKVKKRF